VAKNDEKEIKNFNSPSTNIIGRLDKNNGWQLKYYEYLEGPHGEAIFENCEHCGKSIRNVCSIVSFNGEESKVGPDCAFSLLTLDSEDINRLKNFVGNRLKQKKFLNAVLSYIEEISNFDDEIENDIYSLSIRFYINGGIELLNDKSKRELAFLKKVMNLNYSNNSKWLLELLLDAEKRLLYSKGYEGFSRNGDYLNHHLYLSKKAIRTWYRILLREKKSELVKAIKESFNNGIESRDKKYFFSEKRQTFVSAFLEDYMDILAVDNNFYDE